MLCPPSWICFSTEMGCNYGISLSTKNICNMKQSIWSCIWCLASLGQCFSTLEDPQHSTLWKSPLSDTLILLPGGSSNEPTSWIRGPSGAGLRNTALGYSFVTSGDIYWFTNDLGSASRNPGSTLSASLCCAGDWASILTGPVEIVWWISRHLAPESDLGSLCHLNPFWIHLHHQRCSSWQQTNKFYWNLSNRNAVSQMQCVNCLCRDPMKSITSVVFYVLTYCQLKQEVGEERAHAFTLIAN